MTKASAAALLCLLFAPLTHGTAAAVSPEPQESLDPVVVEGTRAQLSEMRQELIRLEDDFFDRYNELNTIDDFDTHCFQEARIGTLLKRRYCRPVYQSEALEAEASEYLKFLRQSVPEPGAAGQPPKSPPGPPSPAIMAYVARQSDYQKNMLEVAGRDPELVRLLRERFELGKRYEATQRKVYGRKPPPEEEAASAAQLP